MRDRAGQMLNDAFSSLRAVFGQVRIGLNIQDDMTPHGLQITIFGKLPYVIQQDNARNKLKIRILVIVADHVTISCFDEMFKNFVL